MAETEERDRYFALQEMILTTRGEITQTNWNVAALPLVVAIIKRLSGAVGLGADVAAFLSWPQANPTQESDATILGQNDNLLAYPSNAPQVRVRLGSIHSAKGETHTATLVLDSFYRGHHLGELKPWLLGTKTGGSTVNKKGNAVFESPLMLGRLKLHYVGMTRPTHLLCLAMRKDSFFQSELDTLAGRGWRIIDCCEPADAQ